MPSHGATKQYVNVFSRQQYILNGPYFLTIMFNLTGVDPCLANGRKQWLRDKGQRSSHQEIRLEDCQNLRVIHIQRFSRRKECVGEKGMTSCVAKKNISL